jgi:hypothetical protein
VTLVVGLTSNQLVNSESEAWSAVVVLTKSTATNKELRHRIRRRSILCGNVPKPSLIWMVGVKHRVQYTFALAEPTRT